jgi:hypothetical protein
VEIHKAVTVLSFQYILHIVIIPYDTYSREEVVFANARDTCMMCVHAHGTHIPCVIFTLPLVVETAILTTVNGGLFLLRTRKANKLQMQYRCIHNVINILCSARIHRTACSWARTAAVAARSRPEYL